jgi:hypothetical protein
MSKRIALLVPVVLALAAGTALADPVSPPAKGPFAGTVHATADITYVDGSSRAWTWDRGRISALSTTSITLTRRDTEQVTFAITADTIVRNGGATYGQSDLKAGLAATVVSQDGDAVIIRNLRGDGAPGGADPSAITGPLARSATGTIDAQAVDGSHASYEFDRGVITQAGDGQLTVKRPDGEELSFSYGDSTVVRDCTGARGSTDRLVRGEAGMFFSQDGQLELAACVHRLPQRDAAPARRGASAQDAARARRGGLPQRGGAGATG